MRKRHLNSSSTAHNALYHLQQGLDGTSTICKGQRDSQYFWSLATSGTKFSHIITFFKFESNYLSHYTIINLRLYFILFFSRSRFSLETLGLENLCLSLHRHLFPLHGGIFFFFLLSTLLGSLLCRSCFFAIWSQRWKISQVNEQIFTQYQGEHYC